MRKFLTLAVCLIGLNVNAQQIKPKTAKPNAVVTTNGNYKELVSLPTDKTFTDAKGKVFKVFLSNTGKLYIENGISEKTGKMKRKYLVIKL